MLVLLLSLQQAFFILPSKRRSKLKDTWRVWGFLYGITVEKAECDGNHGTKKSSFLSSLPDVALPLRYRVESGSKAFGSRRRGFYNGVQ